MKMSPHKRTIIAFALLLSAFATAAAQNRMTREEYVERYKNIAIANMERYGIPASITMAQGILESDCGNSLLSRSSNNHFGIKCKRDWTGERVYHDDDEKGECFRKYPSVEASYEDHARFLDSQVRYDSLFSYASDDYKSWARGLKAAGYATAPDYAQRLVRIIEENCLYLLDMDNGAARYEASLEGTASVADDFFAEAGAVSESEGINPDDYRITVNAHKGYNVYMTNGVFYVTAKKDDTYESLAETFRISSSNLRLFNDAATEAQPAEGDIVYIERKRPRWGGNMLLHTVRKGETLYGISQSYGIRLRALRRMNRLRGDKETVEGQTVKLR